MTNEIAPITSATKGARLAIADGYALLFYCVLAIAFTWPAVIDINHVVVGSGGDELGAIWWLWGRINGHIDVWGCTQLVNWPEGLCHPSASQPLIEWPLLALTAIANEVAGYTLFILLALVISAMSGYLLLRNRGLPILASMWGGTAMAFAPPILLQASTGHLAYVLSAPALLAMHYAECWWRERSAREQPALLQKIDVKLGMALALTFWSSIYTGYFFSVAFFAMVLGAITLRLLRENTATRDAHGTRLAPAVGKCQGEFISNSGMINQPDFVPMASGRSLRAAFPLLVGGLMVIAIAAVAVFAANWVLLCQYFGWLPAHVHTQGAAFFSRDYAELSIWGARPWDYFRASTAHPLWGTLLNFPQRISIHGSNIFESSLWPGLFTILFSVIALRQKPAVAATAQLGAAHRDFVVRCAVAACFFAVLSLPPTIDLTLFELPTLSYFLYPLAPMFRVYSRAGIYVATLMGAISAVGLAYLMQGIFESKSRNRRWSAAHSSALFICLTLGVLELLPALPGQAFAAAARPAWISQIGKTANPAAIAHMPWWSDDDTRHYQYLFWQRIHAIPMVNGQSIPKQDAAASGASTVATYEAALDIAVPGGGSVATVWDAEVEIRRHAWQTRWNVTDAQTQPIIDQRNMARTLIRGAVGSSERRE